MWGERTVLSCRLSCRDQGRDSLASGLIVKVFSCVALHVWVLDSIVFDIFW